MVGERRENIMPVDVAIQRVLAYRREVAMLQFTLDEDLKDLMHLQVSSVDALLGYSSSAKLFVILGTSPPPPFFQVLLSSHSSPSHSPRPLERPSASASASPVPSTNHSVLSSLSSPSPSPIDNLFCKICQVQWSGAFNLKQHFKERKHKVKVEELELNRKYGGEKANQLQCCELCKVTCMNETLLKLHLQGKKHEEKLQQLESLQHGEEIPNQPKWCELCKVTCMNETGGTLGSTLRLIVFSAPSPYSFSLLELLGSVGVGMGSGIIGGSMEDAVSGAEAT
ncbi:hypothetical protein ACB092_09G189300 [Castanea dentata]